MSTQCSSRPIVLSFSSSSIYAWGFSAVTASSLCCSKRLLTRQASFDCSLQTAAYPMLGLSGPGWHQTPRHHLLKSLYTPDKKFITNSFQSSVAHLQLDIILPANLQVLRVPSQTFHHPAIPLYTRSSPCLTLSPLPVTTHLKFYNRAISITSLFPVFGPIFLLFRHYCKSSIIILWLLPMSHLRFSTQNWNVI